MTCNEETNNTKKWQPQKNTSFILSAAVGAEQARHAFMLLCKLLSCEKGNKK